MAKAAFYFIVGMLIFGVYIFIENYTSGSEEKQSKKTTAAPEKKKQDWNFDTKRSWNYNDTEDKMDGTKMFRAMLLSTNSINFGFPFENNTFYLMIRNFGKGNEVLLQSSGQPFMISFNNNDKCRVKFDDESSVNYGFNSATTSMGTIFFKNPKTFISKLKNSKNLMIGCFFYEAGEKIIEFDTKGFQWDR
jgi:hypothetical protein